VTRDELVRLAEDWISLWCAPVDWERFRRLHAEGFEDHASAGRPATRDGFAEGIAQLVRAFPDLETRTDDVVVDLERGRLAVRWSASGTNRRRYLGIGPSHRRTAFSGIEIIEVARGEIVRRWGEWDATDHRAGEWVERYLARLGVAASASLGELQRAHLLAIPFENLSIHTGEKIPLDVDWLLAKILDRGRGGFCYELNGVFAELLRALGHEVELLAARVCRDDGSLGIPFDHLCLRVDGAWLCDVGFGDNFVVPLRLDERGLQTDGRRTFRLVEDGPDALLLEDARRPSFRVELTPHELADFAPGCDHHQTSPESSFTQRRVVSRLTSDGRITLRDDRLVVTDAEGAKTETAIATPEAWRRALEAHFGIQGMASRPGPASGTGL
jgi:N-hydroxyarylamine O-acetyltransferase